MEDLIKRVEALELQVAELKEATRGPAPKRRATGTNKVGEESEYGLKIYGRGWLYDDKVGERVGFAHNRRALAEAVVRRRTQMLVYVEYMRRIFGIVQVTDGPFDLSREFTRYPHGVTTEWVVTPRSGLTLKEAGLSRLRIRTGDTFFFLTEDEFQHVRQLLERQEPLDTDLLRQMYPEIKGM
ncbi:MAG: hypothetical protein ACOY94_29350 [Bacillota bacterium]